MKWLERKAIVPRKNQLFTNLTKKVTLQVFLLRWYVTRGDQTPDYA